MKIAILGSCVTRDIFTIAQSNAIITKYIARQSMIALNTSPITLDYSASNDSIGGWRAQMVELGATKGAFDEIANADFDTLIFDLIDERCHCVATPDGRAVAYSPEMMELSEGTGFLAANKLSLDWAEWPYARYRIAALHNFAKNLRTASGGRQIVMHEAYWAQKVVGKSPVTYDPNWVGRANDMLELCYSYLQDELGCCVIGKGRSTIRGDSDHKWGGAPYHYTPDYYETVLRQLEANSHGGREIKSEASWTVVFRHLMRRLLER